MSGLAAKKVSVNILKSLFLPKLIQANLSVSSDSQMAVAVEPWMESYATSKIRNLKSKIDEPTKKIEAIVGSDRRHSKSRGRSGSKMEGKYLCWYHYMFGKQTK